MILLKRSYDPARGRAFARLARSYILPGEDKTKLRRRRPRARGGSSGDPPPSPPPAPGGESLDFSVAGNSQYIAMIF